TLVTNDMRTPYSGMLPGFVEGVWNDEDLHIDLAKLAQFANARIVHAPCTGIDAEHKRLLFDDRPPLRFDVLSINIGGQPALDVIDGAADHAIPVKPIAQFQRRLDEVIKTKQKQNLAVIGGGAAGCELALALSKRWLADTGERPKMRLFSRSSRLMPQMAPRASKLIEADLKAIGAYVHKDTKVTKIHNRSLSSSDGQNYDFDACFLVSAVKPPSWVAESTIECDEDGFIRVGQNLQSLSHPYIFASGDIAALHPYSRPKAGVFAVRAGRILAHNLFRYIRQQSLLAWKPQSNYLALIGTSDGAAIAARGSFGFKSRFLWQLKIWIDQRFIDKYKSFDMPPAPKLDHLKGINTNEAKNSDPAFSTMRCLGCGAKTGHETLQNAMCDAVSIAVDLGADPDLMPDDSLQEDAASFVSPSPDMRIVQSVDMLSEIVTDPFKLGQIASVHALSDIYAVLGKPLYSLAIINLNQAKISIQTDQLTHILAGALLAHSMAGVKLVGGHTSEDGTLSVGFAVTGIRPDHAQKSPVKDDAVIILSKPVGTGIVMAGHMQLKARGDWVTSSINSMCESNRVAADIAMKHGIDWVTDVTGFGLARHALNLAIRAGAMGCYLYPDSIIALPGAELLANDNVVSSLAAQNQAAVRLDFNGFDRHKTALLFDPQTSGGLAMLANPEQADKIMAALTATGHQPAIVGRISHQSTGITLTSDGVS
ncbi:selenide, water dikinase SelD, partial [Candidatus Puniceispirillum sp.]|uniref:selenide, water dikinase SelD n=1 Tax=Candidatus Puniceispirillum sp. TaxID=2026719 RepID=UPI001ED73BCC|nr:selenide, water dikinase SelD [Candidatus Puniceispirillum sp.]